MSRVLFKLDPGEAERTVIDTAVPQAAPVAVGRLAAGPALAAFDAGVYEVSAPVAALRFARTLIGMPAPLHLPAPIDDDTIVIDDPDAIALANNPRNAGG